MAFWSLQVLIWEWGDVGSPFECSSWELPCIIHYRSKNNCHIIPWPRKIILECIAGCTFRECAKNLVPKNGQGEHEATITLPISHLWSVDLALLGDLVPTLTQNCQSTNSKIWKPYHFIFNGCAYLHESELCFFTLISFPNRNHNCEERQTLGSCKEM